MHNGRRASEKPQDIKKTIKTLFKYLKPFLVPLIISILFSILASILNIIGPDKLKDITNVITEGLATEIDLNKVKSICTILIIIYLFSALFGYLEHIVMARVNNNFSKKLRKEIIDKINSVPLAYFDHNSYGDILSRVTNDVDTVTQSLNESISQMLTALSSLIGVLVMMYITSFQMATTAILSTIFGFFLMFVIISKSQKYFAALQNDIGDLNGHIEEVYTGHNVVVSYNATSEVNKAFNEINDRLADNFRKSQFLSRLMGPLMGFIGNFGYVCICIVGSILVMNGSIDFGVIVAFMMYVRLFSNPLNQIAQSASSLQSCSAAAERIFGFLDEEELSSENEINKYLDPKKVKGKIEFNHVKFGYDENKTIIKDFNAIANPGEKIAIVGETGAGKTTMVNLLMKFYEINSGDILIDEVSTKELTRKNIHDLFIMVLQDTWTFEGSIKENIKYNNKDITMKDIENVCKIVGLDYFIKTLPNGYDTNLTDNDLLSNGQKQLLTIARGMIKNAPFLILDEATSSVDTRTEELVQKAMDKLTKGRTSFIIAHRLSTIKNADLILMMENGNIVEAGTHEELLKLNGKYSELYNSQFEKIK